MTSKRIKVTDDIVTIQKVYHVVNDIKRGIQLCRDARVGGSMLKLVYSGIDVMAFLSMPKSVKDSQIGREQSKYFKRWVEKYLKFLHPNCTGGYLWEARNGLLHSHSAESIKVRRDDIPRILYRYRGFPHVRRGVDEDGRQVIMISMEQLVDELFSGIDRFVLAQLAHDETSELLIEKCDRMLKAVDIHGNLIEAD